LPIMVRQAHHERGYIQNEQRETGRLNSLAAAAPPLWECEP
jgi:hypothetical protein